MESTPAPPQNTIIELSCIYLCMIGFALLFCFYRAAKMRVVCVYCVVINYALAEKTVIGNPFITFPFTPIYYYARKHFNYSFVFMTCLRIQIFSIYSYKNNNKNNIFFSFLHKLLHFHKHMACPSSTVNILTCHRHCCFSCCDNANRPVVVVVAWRFGYSGIYGAEYGWPLTFGCAQHRYWIYVQFPWIGMWRSRDPLHIPA